MPDLRPVSFELKTLKTLIPQEAFVFNVFNSKATKSQIWDSGASVFLMFLMFLVFLMFLMFLIDLKTLKTLIPRKACVFNVFN